MEKEIRLERKDSINIPHQGYGAGAGTIIKEEYICPCGKGTVFYEKDDTPGFREKFIFTNCTDCDNKYSFRRGTAEPK